MNIYEAIIEPQSLFISPIQGDMLFGSLCWQLENMGHDLNVLLKDYETNPFMVVSSGFMCLPEDGKYIFPRPHCPSYFMNKGNLPESKQNDKRYFSLFFDETADIDNLEFEEYFRKAVVPAIKTHNAINRITGTTGGTEFAPYYSHCFAYDKRYKIAVFIAVDENRISMEALKTSFENIGLAGFGKKASAGYGHFSVKDIRKSQLWHKKDGGFRDFSGCNALYALSPFVPTEQKISRSIGFFYQPLTKYGKHGDVLALGSNPFKKPVIMADSASVIAFKDGLAENFIIGRSIKGLSYKDERTVMQGYAVCLPCKMEIYK